MEAVDADPADPRPAVTDALLDVVHQLADPAPRVRRDRHGEEQPHGPGLVDRRLPAIASRRGAHPPTVGLLALPRRRDRAAGSRARASASRQPIDLDRLVLEQLVRLEEVLDLDEAVRSHLLQPLDVGLVRVALGDAQDLEVGALLVAHVEHADRSRPDMAARERRLVD